MRPPPPRRISPWAALGMRGNPFRRLHEGELAESLISPRGERESIGVLLGSAFQVVQFVGESGWGKSTHLRACHHAAAVERRAGCRFDHVPLWSDRLELPGGVVGMWFVDEMQRVRPVDRQHAWEWGHRTRGRMFIGTHEDLRTEIAAAALGVLTISLAAPDPEAVLGYVARRIELAGGDAKCFGIEPAAIQTLHAVSHGSFHRIEAILYEASQAGVEKAARQGRTLLLDTSGIERAARRLERAE